MSIARTLGLALAAAFTAALPSAQTVIVVDDQGGGDYLQIQPAIDAAGPTDVILVKPTATRYAPFTLTAKSLTLVGDAPGGVRVESGSVVQNTLAADRVVLRGLSLGPAPALMAVLAPALRLSNNAGQIWIEDCALTYGAPSLIEISGSAAVVLLRTTALHQPFLPFSVPPREAIAATQSTVHVFESSFRGAEALGGGFFNGSPAVSFDAGQMFFSGCALQGGDGKGGLGALGMPVAGAGGDGLVIGPAGGVHSIDTTYAGGLGGTHPSIGSGPDGSPISDPNVVTFLPGSARTYTADSPIRAGGTTNLTLTGESGDAIATLFSFQRESIFSFDLFGTLLVGFPMIVTFHGFLPAGNPTLTLPATFAPFPPNLPYLHFYLQSFVFTPFGNPQLGSATAVTVLNQVY